MATSNGRSQTGYGDNRYNNFGSGSSQTTWREGMSTFGQQLDLDFGPDSLTENKEFKDILNEIEQYKDNPYIYNQLMNAYKKYTEQRFSPNLLQSIGSAFGDNSAYQNFVNGQISGLRTEIAEILNALHTEEYQDPVAQEARISAAGINSDLNGGSQIDTGESGDIAFPENMASLQNDGQSSIAVIAQGASNVFTSVMGFIGNLKQFQLQNISIASNELTELTSADSWLQQMLKRTIRYNFGDGSDTNSGSWNNALLDALDSITRSDEFNRLNRHTRKAVKTIVSNYDVDNISSKALYEEMKNEYLSSRAKNVEIESGRNFSQSLSKWIENSQPYFEKLYESQMKEFEAKMKSPEKVEVEIDASRASASASRASARASNASANMTEYRKEKVETIGSLFDGIKRAIPRDAWYKGIAEWFTEMSRIMTIQALVKE